MVGERDYAGVTIVAFEKGKVAFRMAGGSLERADLSDVKLIVVDSVVDSIDLNQAERWLSEGKTVDAAERYERALKTARDFWIDLIIGRLQQIYNRTGPIDKLAENFTRLVERHGATALALLPSELPVAKPGESQRAIKVLETAQERLLAASERAPLILLKYLIGTRAGDAGLDALAAEVASLPLPADAASEGAYWIKLDAFDQLLKTEQRPQVLLDIDDAIELAPLSVLPDVLLLKARALYEDAHGRDDFVRAGWAYMRVAIHFRDDGRSAEGLLGAARVYERLELPEKAAELLRECLGHRHATEPTKERARSALERLSLAKGRKSGS